MAGDQLRHYSASNAGKMEIRIFISLGDKWIPLFRPCLKVNSFIFEHKSLFINIITK